MGTPTEIYEIQKDLDKLFDCTNEWQMLFNVDKCKCIHYGHNNPQHTYSIGGNDVVNDSKEKDLGVIINDSLSVSDQVSKVVNTANSVLGLIYRAYEDKSKQNIIKFYKSLVRPHLEYSVQAWCPYLKKDIEKIEKVQHRATRMISSISNLSYDERLIKTNLITLENRRLRSDIIEVWKIMHGLEGLSPNDLFIMSSTMHDANPTRGHTFKIFKQHSRLNLRKFFFSHRIVDTWNSLPAEIAECMNINTLKNKLSNFFNWNC